MFEIAPLLQPISAAAPCGEDLSFSSEFDAIARARQFDDPSLDQGDWQVALKEADWPFVAARSAQLLATRSKDLRLAVWLAEAQAKTRRLRGLGDALALLTGLCDGFWEGLHPLPEDGDHEQRIGNLAWLLARLPQLVKEMPLAESADTPSSLRDIEAAQRAARTVQGGDPYGSEPAPAAGPDGAELEAARRRNSPAFAAALLADAEHCLQALLLLERAVDARLGDQGPSFAGARDVLETVKHLVKPAASAALVVAQEGAPVPAVAAAWPGVAGGAPLDRVQALAQLRQVADFFRRTEPHSPVAYLADKSAAWGELPLHLWLRAVVREPAVLAQLNELLGVPESP
jgi:type VI secretion system protein ImpA